MELKVIILLVVIACVQGYGQIEKPGKCPRSTVFTTCDCRPEYIQCNGDFDCPGNLKCCSYGCGCRTHCVRPKYKTRY